MNELNIRQLRLSDFFALHRTCGSFSKNSKRFYYPSWCSKHTSNPLKVIKWFIAQIALFLSLTSLRKFISRFYLRGAPLLVNEFVWRASLLLIGAFDHQKNLIGFAFLKPLYDSEIAGLGIAVIDAFQSKGCGSKLMEQILAIARERKVSKIRLNVYSDNKKAYGLYKKYGFKPVRHQKDVIEMELNL